ncbi:MAG: winged helix-turn-helix domain-containing protein [Nitrososphaeria archaeon]|jgi:DNA-binding MarR family transcriptional regulator
MSQEPKNEKTIKDGVLVLHPMRWKIINALKEDGQPRYIDQIAEKIGADRQLVSFHLSTLEENGFVKSQFKFIERPNSPAGRAGRFYELTDKFDKIRPQLIKLLETKS